MSVVDRIRGLEAERRQRIEEMRTIVEGAERRGGDGALTTTESQRFETLKADAENFKRELAELKERGDGGVRQITPEGATREFRDGSVLGREERMADWIGARCEPRGGLSVSDGAKFSIGRAIRGAVTHDWQGADLERRALAESVGVSGGFVTPEVLSGQFIDRIRNQARVLQAGATTVPLESDQHSIPRLSAGVAAAWRNENTAVFEDDPEFDRITFTPRTLAVTTLLSYELAEDMTPESASAIDNDISSALSLELDRVGLRGSGVAPEPRGVRNQPGVTVTNIAAPDGAAPVNWDWLIDSYARAQARNLTPNAVIYSSRTAKTHAKLKTTDNSPLPAPPYLADLEHLVSNQVPNTLTTGLNADTSEAYVGKWDELLIGVRPTIGVRFARQSKDETLQWRITAWLRADIQLRHSEAFDVTTGIRA